MSTAKVMISIPESFLSVIDQVAREEQIAGRDRPVPGWDTVDAVRAERGGAIC